MAQDLQHKPGPQPAAQRAQAAQAATQRSEGQQQANAARPDSVDSSLPTVVVAPGQTLWDIAAAQYGDGQRWVELWQANRARVPNANAVRVGTVLVIPPLRAATPRTPTVAARTTQPPPGQPEHAPPPLSPDAKKAVGKTPAERMAADLYNAKGRLIVAQAARVGIEPGVAAACMMTETGGRGQKGGQMTIRFEPAVFHKYTQQTVADTHTNQAAEWQAFAAAKAINEQAAFDSISMGAAQVMGFNAVRLGYADAQKMFAALSGSEDAQAIGFFEFIRTSKALLQAAQAKDWPNFARLYNGPAYAQNAYDVKMATYYAAWQRVTTGLNA